MDINILWKISRIFQYGWISVYVNGNRFTDMTITGLEKNIFKLVITIMSIINTAFKNVDCLVIDSIHFRSSNVE